MSENLISVCVVISTLVLIHKSRILRDLFENIKFRKKSFYEERELENLRQLRHVLESIKTLNQKASYENFNELKLEDDKINNTIVSDKQKIDSFKTLTITISEIIEIAQTY